jgi:hypothetical protein
MRKADNGDSANVLTDIDAAFTTLDSLFDPAALSVAQAPRVVMRETIHNPTYVGPANTIDLRPVWNAPGSTLRGLFIDATHTGAGASSRVIEVRRSGNPIWDVDITTQNAVNGLSLQGGAAGQPVKLAAIGTDTNVGITLTPKGTGAITLSGSVVMSSGFSAGGDSAITGQLSGVTTLTASAVTTSGLLTMTAAASRIVPGATSWSVRNNANSADNFLVIDSGLVTVRLALAGPGTVASAGDVRLANTAAVSWRNAANSNNLQLITTTSDNWQFIANGTQALQIGASGIGFYNTNPSAKQTVTGSRGGNAALASLLSTLATLGLLTDSTTA